MIESYLRKHFKADWDGESPIVIRNFFRKNLALLFKQLGFKYGAEIGVDMGGYSKVLCESNPGVRLLCIDPWKEYPIRGDQKHRDRCFAIAQETLKEFDVVFMRQTSMEIFKEIPNEALDFVYIDGDHRYRYIKEDLQWEQKVRIGGIVSGHDYYISSEVPRAVKEYVIENEVQRWFLTALKRKDVSFFWMKV